MERFNAEASAIETQRAVALAAVQRNTAQIWPNRWYAAHTVQLLAEQTASVALQVEAAGVAYRGNRGSRAGTAAACLERRQLQDRTDEVRVTEASAGATLRRWVGDASNRPLAIPLRPDVSQWLDTLDGTAIDILPDVAAASA